MNVTIRQAEEEDLPAIQAFLRESYGILAPFKAEHRWRWQFAENPFRLSLVGGIPVWIAVDGRTVIGQMAVQSASVVIDRNVRPAGWIVDVMIAPAYRGRGLGHALFDAVSSAVPVLLMLTMARATRRIAERGGAIPLGEAWQFSRWISLRPDDVRRYLLSRLKHRPGLLGVARLGCDVFDFHRIFAILGNLAVAIRNEGHGRVKSERDISETERFGPENDELWRSIGHQFEASVIRDSRYLNWRFVDCPDLMYRRFVARVGACVVGYSVLRLADPIELRVGTIAEIFAAPDDTVTLNSLLDHAMRFFGADIASIECVTSSPEIARLLRARAFIRTRTTVATGAFQDQGLRAQARLLRGGWLFTKGDHDWDQVQVA